jgi:tRNA(Arg) A34 adenosine deaminase TadA
VRGQRALDRRLMGRAIERARAAAAVGEVPVGAVIAVGPHEIVATHNRRELDRDPTAHAELIALRAAARSLGRWRLSDATLYVTLEPCVMCAGALIAARIGRVVYGAEDPKAGAVRARYALLEDPRLNHRVEVVRGVEGEACSALLRDFFSGRRAAPPDGRDDDSGYGE